MPTRSRLILAFALLLAAVSGAAAQGVLHVPAMPEPRGADDVVGLIAENLAGNRLPATPLTFGQAFLPGGVPAGAHLVARIGEKDLPVQVDAKTTYPDGSLRMAVLGLIIPSFEAHGRLPVMLARGGAGAEQPAVDLARLASDGYDLAIDLTFHQPDGSTAPFHLDAGALLKQALAGGKPDYWLHGPVASEIRFDAPVMDAFHVVFDVRAYADGTTHTDLKFANDDAMQKTGGAVTYDAVLREKGKIIAQYKNLKQFQYEDWHREVWSAAPPPIALARDIDYLERIGVIANYDLKAGVPSGLLAAEVKQMASPGWGAPLAANGITQYMPMTGGRPDIGPTTRANAIWLMTQEPAAAAYALWQAEAAAGIPWHFWIPTAHTWLNTNHNPQIWTDSRGGANGLTQPVDGKNNGWAPDTAHQPDLSFVAYLLTGSRFHLDELNAQASFSIVSTWPGMRNQAIGGNGNDNVIFGNQMRGAAWCLREIDEAAYANPAGSAEKAYFTQVMNDNWSWLVSQIPTWTTLEGQAHGYIIAPFQYGVALAPWQQDYFVSTAMQAAEMGNQDALTYLKWATNFIAGSIFNLGHDSINYGINAFPNSATSAGQIYWDSATNSWAYAKPLQTWSAIGAAMQTSGSSNGTGWVKSEGDYGQLRLMALAEILSLVPSSEAQTAYEWLRKSGAPFTDHGSLLNAPEFNIIMDPSHVMAR